MSRIGEDSRTSRCAGADIQEGRSSPPTLSYKLRAAFVVTLKTSLLESCRFNSKHFVKSNLTLAKKTFMRNYSKSNRNQITAN